MSVTEPQQRRPYAVEKLRTSLVSYFSGSPLISMLSVAVLGQAANGDLDGLGPHPVVHGKMHGGISLEIVNGELAIVNNQWSEMR